MKRVSFLVFFLFWAASTAAAGQIIGQLTDPCDMGIDGYTDITKAWVEKDGSRLTFVMELRGQIPEPCDLPEYDDTITYLWLVDADTNPKTGQSTWNLVGGEFNVRVVISQDPGRAGGFVDVVGALEGGGGNGAVVVDGNRIQITIDRSQIASVKRFCWRSDAFKDFHGYGESYNMPTPMSGLARVCKYGVVYDINDINYKVGENSIVAFMADDPCTPVIDMVDEDGGDFPIFLSIERKYPDQNDCRIFAEAMGHSGMNHLRTFSRLAVSDADPAAYGQSEAKAMFDCNFRLDGEEGQTGPIPQGVFFLKYNHNYHILANDENWMSSAWTFAQIVLNQVEPLIQKGVWVHQKQIWNDDFFTTYSESIDLADYGFEFGITYRISTLLSDRADVPAETTSAQAVTDSTFITSIEAVGPAGDLDGDWDVDMTDLAGFANSWLESW